MHFWDYFMPWQKIDWRQFYKLIKLLAFCLNQTKKAKTFFDCSLRCEDLVVTYCRWDRTKTIRSSDWHSLFTKHTTYVLKSIKMCPVLNTFLVPYIFHLSIFVNNKSKSKIVCANFRENLSCACCPTMCCPMNVHIFALPRLDWFWRVWTPWRQKPESQTSFTASSMLTSSLSSPPCFSSSVYLKGSSTPPPAHRHSFLSELPHMRCCPHHICHSLTLLCIARFNQFSTLYTWSPTEHKTTNPKVCFLGKQSDCVCQGLDISQFFFLFFFVQHGILKFPHFENFSRWRAGQASHCCSGSVNADLASFPKRWFLCVFLSPPILPHC